MIGGTHGDEPIGVTALTALSKERSDFDWVVGNPRAVERGTREFEGDLNRSGPGMVDASSYALRRAAELIAWSRQYRYTIDLHGTANNTGMFVIVTRLTLRNLRLATLLRIPRIVLWPSCTKEMQGALSAFFPCGVEIECGRKNDPAVAEQLIYLLRQFLRERSRREEQDWIQHLRACDLYIMVGHLITTGASVAAGLNEFCETTLGGETFCPVFIDTYSYKDVLCYKLKKLTWQEALSRCGSPSLL